ncbi:MAG: hypothetical protein HYU28_04585 [Actinobacteria bacterium]|nr:hypothetical protein [Actinomycetota bacterium]
MELRIAVAVAVVVLAALAAAIIQRRRPAPPTGDGGPIPRQIDRADFARPDAPWLVVLFSSEACDSCAGVAAKLPPLESDEVAVQDVEWSADRALHRRYQIEAVPLTLVADGAGEVRAAFYGAVTATDLWAAVAEVRTPGSSPEPGLGRTDF